MASVKLSSAASSSPPKSKLLTHHIISHDLPLIQNCSHAGSAQDRLRQPELRILVQALGAGLQIGQAESSNFIILIRL